MLTLYKLREYIVYPGKLDDRSLNMRYHDLNRRTIGVYIYKASHQRFIGLYTTYRDITYQCTKDTDEVGDTTIQIKVRYSISNGDELLLTTKIINGNLNHQDIKITSKKQKTMLPIWHF
jgi:hypothetical protein